MADTPGIPNPPGKTRLVQHFEKSEIEDHNEAWANLWDTNNDDMWDRGRPSPALIDLIEKDDVLNPITAEGRRKKVLVPGCGKGYDVVMLALHGFDVVGLEISSKGISIAEEYSRKEFLDPQTYNSGPSGSSNTSLVGRGSVTFIQGDFFKGDSLSDEKFDIIYDYTFLCAIHPRMRAQWATRMADLLITGGLLVCLEFPLFKDPGAIGPPWPLQGVHWDLLVEGGDGIVYPSTTPEKVPRVGGGGFERLRYIKPERSYESGRGTDMLSVYVKK